MDTKTHSKRPFKPCGVQPSAKRDEGKSKWTDPFYSRFYREIAYSWALAQHSYEQRRSLFALLLQNQIKGQTTYLTKGMWDVAGDYMAGPFVNYTLLDQANKRWLVIEGFAFAPSVSKREYMFELNTIIRSLRFVNKKN